MPPKVPITAPRDDPNKSPPLRHPLPDLPDPIAVLNRVNPTTPPSLTTSPNPLPLAPATSAPFVIDQLATAFGVNTPY